MTEIITADTINPISTKYNIDPHAVRAYIDEGKIVFFDEAAASAHADFLDDVFGDAVLQPYKIDDKAIAWCVVKNDHDCEDCIPF